MKKFLSIVLSLAMILSTMSTVVFADNTATTYQVGANGMYADLNAAITANAGAADAIYEVYGEVELEIPGTHGDFDFNDAKVIGMDDDAQVTVVGGGVSDIINVNMESVKFADAGTYSPSSSEFMYQNFSGTSTFVDVEFLDGVRFCNSYVGTSAVITVSECSFYEDSENEYPLWIDGGEVTITDSSIEGTRGVKLGDARYTADNLELEVSGCEFKNISKKPAFVVSNVDSASTVVIEEATLTNCDYGLLVNEVANYKGIEVDGKSPAYVASKGNEYYTDMAYALKEAGDSSNLTEYVAEKDGVYFESLAEAMTAKGTTVNLLKDIDLGNGEWEPVSLKGNFNGNGHTISNLKINKPDTDYVGFITSVNGTFENVNFVNVNVVGRENVGAVAGRAGGSAALVKNVTVTGDIKVESTTDGYARAAVIVGGWAYGKYIDITVDGGSSDTSYVKHAGGGDGRYCAGIVGHADDVQEYTNCVVKNITIDGGWLCGGIAGPGPSDGTATGCVVENVKIASDYSGGMFGWYFGDGTIENSTVKNVEFTDGGTNNGAIGGYGMAPNVVVKNATIENVVNYGGAPMISYLAAIGDTLYPTLAAAVEAAADGEVVTLLADETGAAIKIKKSVTVDFGGYTYTVDSPAVGSTGTETLAFQLLAGSNASPYDVTFKNGKIAIAEDNDDIQVVIMNYSNLTLEDMVVDATGTPYAGWPVASNNGETKIIGNTSLIANPNTGGVALDVDGSQNYYGTAKLTVDTTGTIDGSVDVYGDESDFIVNNGNFTGAINVTDNGNAVINGGFFATDVSAYLADGLVLAPNGNGFTVVTDDTVADSIEVIFEDVTDADAEGEKLYNINLVAPSKDIINRLNSGDLTFVFDPEDGKSVDFEIIDIANDNISVAPVDNSKYRYEFHFDTKTGVENDTANTITIAQVKFEGYGKFSFKVDETAVDEKGNKTNAVHTTKLSDNIVDTFVVGGGEGKGTLIINNAAENTDNDNSYGFIDEAEITVPTRTLTINIDFPNAVENNVAAYQDMTVTIVGGTVDETIKLGTDGDDDDYSIEKDLPYNTPYTVTVKGAGYRTARYTVTLNDNKTLNFWNNVKDIENAKAIEDKGTVKVTKNFLAGDIVKDNNINIYDLSAVVSYFNTNTNTTAKDDNAKYDLNRDGVINSKDVAYVLVSWGE